jgi:hypothetical protein
MNNAGSTSLLGAAAEYYVMYRLLRMGKSRRWRRRAHPTLTSSYPIFTAKRLRPFRSRRDAIEGLMAAGT